MFFHKMLPVTLIGILFLVGCGNSTTETNTNSAVINNTITNSETSDVVNDEYDITSENDVNITDDTNQSENNDSHVFESSKWHFTLNYPENLVENNGEHSSNFTTDYFVLDINTSEGMNNLNMAEGTEVSLFFRLVADIEEGEEMPVAKCLDDQTSLGSIDIDGVSGLKCTGSSLGSDTLRINFIKDGITYTIQSDKYFESDSYKTIIDEIISSLKFI